ncbi:MAG TPA: hypothetical protein VK253_05720 [Candidatus Binatia bacterium]|nr:hypothetical protein [Candidatus Binatia bacterium]
MARKKCWSPELSVFKGREARLNLAIFIALALLGPLTITGLQKQVSKQKGLEGTYYASLTKRLRCLDTDGYITGLHQKTRGKAVTYQIANKAYLAMFFYENSLQEILDQATENEAAFLLLSLLNIAKLKTEG